MHGRFVYGEAGGVLIFLLEETARTLGQLWDAISTAETWRELRAVVGDEMTAMLSRIAEYAQYPGDDAPFDSTPIVSEYAKSWSVDQLLRISASELPHMADLVQTTECMRLLSQYLRASSDTESRIVLQLVGMGFGVDRNDALIAQCLALPACCRSRDALYRIDKQPDSRRGLGC